MMKRLTRDQVRAAIKFKTPPRAPIAHALRFVPELWKKYPEELAEIKATYPDDISFHNIHVDYWEGTPDNPGYRWAFGNKQKPAGLAIDSCPVIEDWSQLDDFLNEMPSPLDDKPYNEVKQLAEANPDDYILISFGHYFQQKLAAFRGIENLMIDFYDNTDHLHRLLEAILGYYRILAERVAAAGANGIYGGEDLGHQKSLFMSPGTFREIYKPYYKRFAEILHGNGLDFWMHSCGNITEIMPDIIECGIDVLHPIQVGTMNDEAIVKQYSGQICFHVGMDVQSLIPFGTPQQIREGIRKRALTFYRPEGGVIYAAGNVITDGTPIENIRAYAEELFSFVETHRV
jgi:uroporphyrinogen decarboxylase